MAELVSLSKAHRNRGMTVSAIENTNLFIDDGEIVALLPRGRRKRIVRIIDGEMKS